MVPFRAKTNDRPKEFRLCLQAELVTLRLVTASVALPHICSIGANATSFRAGEILACRFPKGVRMTISTSRRPRRQAPKLRERQALEFIAHGKTARLDQVAQVLAPGCAPAIDDEPRRRLRKDEPKPPPKAKGGTHTWPLGRHQRVAATLPLVNDWMGWRLALKVYAL